MDTESKIDLIVKMGRQYRSELFEKFNLLGQGHPGSTFSMVDIVTTLFYGGFVKPGSDKILVSKGHATVALYPILRDFGVIGADEWENWGRGDSILRVFGNVSIPGIDVTSGSLGHGVGVGAGLALSSRISGKTRKHFVIISEGEFYEGSTWEALLFLDHHQLSNVTVIVDINNLIILGDTKSCLRLSSLKQKLDAFDFWVNEIDGHSVDSLVSSFSIQSDRPKVLLCNTVKGKGFSLMENQPHWHYWNPLTPEQVQKCRSEIK